MYGYVVRECRRNYGRSIVFDEFFWLPEARVRQLVKFQTSDWLRGHVSWHTSCVRRLLRALRRARFSRYVTPFKIRRDDYS